MSRAGYVLVGVATGTSCSRVKAMAGGLLPSNLRVVPGRFGRTIETRGELRLFLPIGREDRFDRVPGEALRTDGVSKWTTPDISNTRIMFG